MKNQETTTFEVLSDVELAENRGGIINLLIAGAALCFAAYSAGYLTGKAIF
ncbi:MAG: hypothetical protein K1X47_14860 [Cyclobacteriaceae bacterium]|nr:hypothetical protein [Cyclobacteriaceae bacterium]